ncbi:DUF2538 family protein [Planococcus lenghuensis]|uniref:Uncharacterized protein n=1 Tax=Planococcus lenghuensis TaxID=2213202 RepID=A0A1Q2L5A6_9BACL|nr:DUF2538 family protein [Planococcus lenghuensis]AQQ55628.1 hypothetical protein B0X71_20860 [Planococcus lenghuensis]
MYFINQNHEDNFIALRQYYSKQEHDPEYQAHLYIAAVPELFDLLDPFVLQKASGAALTTLMTYNEQAGNLMPSHGGLTSATTHLLEIGMSLYNGYPCNLDFRPSNEHAEVIIQALKIRYGL